MSRVQCAGVIINKAGKILLLRRNFTPGKGKLDFIGGLSEAGETPEQTAVRETKEETGLDVKLVHKLGAYDYFEREPKTAHLYVAEIISGKLKSSLEGNLVWVALNNFNLQEDLAFPQHAPTFVDYKEYLAENAHRKNV